MNHGEQHGTTGVPQSISGVPRTYSANQENLKSTEGLEAHEYLQTSSKTHYLHNVPNHFHHHKFNKLAEICVQSVHTNNYISYIICII